MTIWLPDWRAAMPRRAAAGLPPYAHLAMLGAEGKTQAAAQAFLDQAAQAVEAHAAELGGILLYPPVPTAVAKVANVERAQMLIEATHRGALLRLLQQATGPWLSLAQKNRPSGLIRWAVDVDPLAI